MPPVFWRSLEGAGSLDAVLGDESLIGSERNMSPREQKSEYRRQNSEAQIKP